MNTLSSKQILIVLFAFVMVATNGQTFSTSDYFSMKSNSKKITTGQYIIELSSKKADDKFVISGRIIDKTNKKAIGGINVMEKGTTNGTTTASDGAFMLRTNSDGPILTISYMGFSSDEINVPKAENDNEPEDNSLTSLSGILVANLGEESIIQPNIVLSQGWKMGRNGVELRILGLQNNKDTLQLSNGLNLIKPEISRINFRLTGNFIPIKKLDMLSTNFELNIFRQQLNHNDIAQNVQSNSISSLLLKLTLGYCPTDGINIYGSGVYYHVLEGVQYFEDRFGPTVAKSFWNFELSGKFFVQNGVMKGTFIQALYTVNSSDYRQLLGTKDYGVFLIKMGFNKALIKK
jgi:hypothetical protein